MVRVLPEHEQAKLSDLQAEVPPKGSFPALLSIFREPNRFDCIAESRGRSGLVERRSEAAPREDTEPYFSSGGTAKEQS